MRGIVEMTGKSAATLLDMLVTMEVVQSCVIG